MAWISVAKCLYKITDSVKNILAGTPYEDSRPESDEITKADLYHMTHMPDEKFEQLWEKIKNKTNLEKLDALSAARTRKSDTERLDIIASELEQVDPRIALAIDQISDKLDERNSSDFYSPSIRPSPYDILKTAEADVSDKQIQDLLKQIDEGIDISEKLNKFQGNVKVYQEDFDKFKIKIKDNMGRLTTLRKKFIGKKDEVRELVSPYGDTEGEKHNAIFPLSKRIRDEAKEFRKEGPDDLRDQHHQPVIEMFNIVDELAKKFDEIWVVALRLDGQRSREFQRRNPLRDPSHKPPQQEKNLDEAKEIALKSLQEQGGEAALIDFEKNISDRTKKHPMWRNLWMSAWGNRNNKNEVKKFIEGWD
jgi:hypothetical protein